MIPFIYRKCCAGINNFLEYSSTKGQSDTLTALNYLARSEHVQPQEGLNGVVAFTVNG